MQRIATHTPWYRRAVERALDRLLAPSAGASASLRDLDARTLADIGVHPSEITSIEAESHGSRAAITRRRIVPAYA